MERMTQKEKIIKYLRWHKYISPMQAFSKLGITKLSTRIGELREIGYEFEKVWVRRKKRSPYMKYRLLKK